MRKQFVAGNWKMNTSKASAIELAKGIAAGVPENVDVGVAPPFVYLDAVGQAIAGSKVLLGAQDCYFEKNGAFTGEISLEMLKDLGVKFCLAGHSERRHVLKETGELVAKKAACIYGSGLILIHCVGEKLEERDSNQTLKVVSNQLDELDPAKCADPSRLVIAYEPVWAIGTGRTPTRDEIARIHVHLRGALTKRFGVAGRGILILYGGSVNPGNAKEILATPEVGGALVGGASLKAADFLAIIEAAPA